MRILFLFISCTLFMSCKNQVNTEIVKETTSVSEKPQRPSAYNKGKFFEANGNKMLYGGKDNLQHFNINNLGLEPKQFHYGMGRELFPALLEPKFISVKEANTIWADSTRFLVAYSGDEVKAYSVKDLTRHEVVNDVLDGNPIMAVYCILADLGAVYDRNYGGQELTFALSGYTYYDPNVWKGLDGFVLWDRETESLWWPLIGKAVSGPLKEVKLLETDKANWKDTTWKTIKEEYPNAQILLSEQDFERPKTWKKIQNVTEIVKNYIKIE